MAWDMPERYFFRLYSMGFLYPLTLARTFSRPSLSNSFMDAVYCPAKRLYRQKGIPGLWAHFRAIMRYTLVKRGATFRGGGSTPRASFLNDALNNPESKKVLTC